VAPVDRALPPAHARDRGGTRDRRGLVARQRHRPALDEALIGAVYAIAAYVLFRVFEAEGRRRASPETY
jgi:hypothetical protein